MDEALDSEEHTEYVEYVEHDESCDDVDEDRGGARRTNDDDEDDRDDVGDDGLPFTADRFIWNKVGVRTRMRIPIVSLSIVWIVSIGIGG